MTIFKRVTSMMLAAATLFSLSAPSIASDEIDTSYDDRGYEAVVDESFDEIVAVAEDGAAIVAEDQNIEDIAAPIEDLADEAEDDAETVYTDWAQKLEVAYDRDDGGLVELANRVNSAYGNEYSIDRDIENEFYLSGWMPVGTFAVAQAVVFEGAYTAGETPVMAFDIALNDGDGNEYCNEYPVYAEIYSKAVTSETESGNELYAYIVDADGGLVEHEIEIWNDHIAFELETLPAEVVVTRWVDAAAESELEEEIGENDFKEAVIGTEAPVVEAWDVTPVTDGASLTLRATITSLPKLSDGESFALYTINNTAYDRVNTDPSVGKSIAVQLEAGAVTGIALVKLAAEPVEQTITADSGDTELSFSGLLPAGATVEIKAAETPAELGDAEKAICQSAAPYRPPEEAESDSAPPDNTWYTVRAVGRRPARFGGGERV